MFSSARAGPSPSLAFEMVGGGPARTAAPTRLQAPTADAEVLLLVALLKAMDGPTASA